MQVKSLYNISNTGKTGGKSDFLVAPTRLVPIQAICEPSGQF